MLTVSLFCFFFLPSILITRADCSAGRDREMYFPTYYFFADRRLINHKIKALHVKDLDDCELHCYRHDNCVSVNIKKDPDNATGQRECELNNSTHMEHDEDLKVDNAYLYRGAKNACGRNPPCFNKAICQSGFTDKGYRCLCYPGFTGEKCKEDIDECTSGALYCSPNATCENNIGSYQCTCKQGFSGDGKECEDIDECATETHNCSSDAVCNNTKGSYNCTCKPGYHGDGKNCSRVELSTCKEIYDSNLLDKSQLVTLKVNSKRIRVYCHLEDFGCGTGGWTPVMKIDGKKNTFHYDSEYWGNENEFNLPGGETEFDDQETKLPTYWSTSFSKICLGMKIDNKTNFIVIENKTNSLYSLIADGQYRATSLERTKWKTLIGSEASLQLYCNREGFNAAGTSNDRYKAVRIGILANNEQDCNSCNSVIGFGTSGKYSGYSTCGNVARHDPDNGDKNIKAMGYILVQ